MSLRYIGSKARVVNEIMLAVGRPSGRGRFVDALCGTGAVAEAAARTGWSIRLNDHLLAAVTMAHARLICSRDVPFLAFGGYAGAVETLNAQPPRPGFIWSEYSPASGVHAGVARMYFTEANAARIDGARGAITTWRNEGAVSLAEERLLLADLLQASNRVANIAGTYGCYLSHWLPQSHEPLVLRPRELFPRQVEVLATNVDVSRLVAAPEDVVYLDPPYTKRQYAAYYHVLETITVGDQPKVGGITGLRPWQEKASDFCYRSRALAALVRLVEQQNARRVLLSYSDQGHVDLEPLADGLAGLGDLSIVALKKVSRYRPNRAASAGGRAVTEYLLIIDRAATDLPKKASA